MAWTEDQAADLDRVAQALVELRVGVALTGAGISVPSGIPDFRSKGGLWERFDPMEYATIGAFTADPHKAWKMFADLDEICRNAKPNPGHEGLAELERLGVLQGIVTQNVDNLHQEAGSACVVEFHGNGRRLVCLSCSNYYEAAMAEDLGVPPCCECGRVLKPDVVLFGEAIPQDAITAAMQLTNVCRVLLVVGTSATVAPASMIPHLAQAAGALLVELNIAPTELTHSCDVVIPGDAAETLPELGRRVRALQERA